LGFTTALIALVVIILLNILVNRIAAAALTFTGMSREMAKFQARSAFSLCGYTTNEAENMVNHPVRRQIVSLLMFFGSVGFIGMVAATLGAFSAQSETPSSVRFGFLIALFILLWFVGTSKWVDDLMFRAISWALRRFTQLEVHDFVNLLQLGAGYNVTELAIEPGDWLVGRRLDELRLSDIGINVLGIHRSNGEFVGTPVGSTYIRRDDQLIVYGARDQILDLDRRKGDPGEGARHWAMVEEKRSQWKKEADARGEGYGVTEIIVRQKSWLVNKQLSEVRLGDAGVTVLGIKREHGGYLGAPTGHSHIRGEDTLVVYGAFEDIAALDDLIRDPEGEQKHLERAAAKRAARHQSLDASQIRYAAEISGEH